MEFNKRYNRSEFINFLQNQFLPEDFVTETTPIDVERENKYIRSITKLGSCETLDLVVYEVRHSSTHDARVGLTKEAFRFLGKEWESKALVLFVPEGSDTNYRFSLITIDLDETEEGKLNKKYSNPRRYSYYLGEGIAFYTPNEYLNKPGRVTNEKDLTERFSVEVLTKAFYQELSDWYAWAVKVVRFPNKLDDETDDDKYNHEAAIRLVTRLIFVWFLKQKHLIPEEFFDKIEINKFVKGFTPDRITDLMYMEGESIYYKGILQNLFFAMLNSPITPDGKDTISERRFSKADYTDYGNYKLMRYEKCFKDAERFLQIANKTVPFLNGGLFDCLDRAEENYYVDGFSDKEKVNKALFVPDYLFFIEDHIVDLSLWYNDRRKSRVAVNGIINILKRYNFTIEENTPFDQEVSLDPELLGKVFENLLASYNEDTKEIARKSTGSFYTPRNIVQLMVVESLMAYLKRMVGEELEPEYRKLISYVDEELSLTAEQKQQILEAIYHCKVLDPACGSGAFPVGMLQQMVHILSQLDPTNEQWKKMMLDEAVNESRNAFQAESKEEREERLRDIEASFDESLNNPDYARKLYLIENCIYGVDIQPIAIQISKLRFFISLVVDQKTTTDPTKNFGIRPLPNLEAKFVAANSLIPLAKSDGELGRTPEIIAIENKLKEANHKIFSAKTVRTKRRWKGHLIELRAEMIEKLQNNGFLTADAANQLAAWDMFDQNSAASFFDADWMFGTKNGFDIVIGNPPYNELRDLSQQEQNLYRNSLFYEYAQGGRVNMFQFFYPLASHYLTDNGICCMITQNSILAEESALNNRKLFFSQYKILNINSFPERDNKKLRVFESAKMSVCVCLLQKCIDLDNSFIVHVWKDKYMQNGHCLNISKRDINIVYPEDLIIPISNNEGWFLLLKMKSHAKYTIIAQAGEIDMTKYKSMFIDTVVANRVLTGAQVLRYKITDNPSQGKVLYLPVNSITLSSDRISAISDFRIVTQRITGVDSKIRIISTLIPPNIYCANSTNYISPNKNNINLKYLLGVLNSKCINFFFKQTSTNTNVTGKEIAKFPIPLCTAQLEYKIIKLVEEILNLKKSNIDSSCQELKIDNYVYHLFNLTYDEVLIIDQDTPITREEYEQSKNS